jgi:hypothetical protein
MFKTLIEHSQISVFIVSVKTRKRTFFNDMFLALFEIKKEDIDSFEPCQTFINPDDLSRTFDAIPSLGNHETVKMEGPDWA